MITFIAHRGNLKKEYPGNSKEALLQSMKEDIVSGVELDVRMTKDKKIIIFHNFMIDDKKHKLRKVSSLTLREIKKYDIDSTNKIIHVSELREFLEEVPNNKKILIEIKEESKNYREFVNELYRVIKSYPELNIYICSFNNNLLAYFKKHYPNYKVGLIIGNFMNLDKLYNSFDFVSITPSMIKDWDFKKETFIWTINSIDEFKKVLKNTNHVGIITDKVALLYNYNKHTI